MKPIRRGEKPKIQLNGKYTSQITTYPLCRCRCAHRTISHQCFRRSFVGRSVSSTHKQSANNAMPMPFLCTGRLYGNCTYSISGVLKILMFVADEISEEELYRNTRNRWMYVWYSSILYKPCVLTLTQQKYNETTQLPPRYLKFDLPQLLKLRLQRCLIPIIYWSL